MSVRALGGVQLVAQLDAARAFGELSVGALEGGGGGGARGEGQEPSLSALARLAEWGGASGVSLSARPGHLPAFMEAARRLRGELGVSLNAQLSPDLDLTRLAFELQPQRVTLVPQRWVGPSVVGGLDPFQLRDELRAQVAQLHEADIEVAVRVEPQLEMVKRLQRFDVDVVVLSTNALMSSGRGASRREQLKRVLDASLLASRLGLRVAVAGAIDLAAAEQLSRVSQISEVHVGHHLLARAMLRGMEAATRDLLVALERGRGNPL